MTAEVFELDPEDQKEHAQLITVRQAPCLVCLCSGSWLHGHACRLTLGEHAADATLVKHAALVRMPPMLPAA